MDSQNAKTASGPTPVYIKKKDVPADFNTLLQKFISLNFLKTGVMLTIPQACVKLAQIGFESYTVKEKVTKA
jgi:hypothetical protein